MFIYLAVFGLSSFCIAAAESSHVQNRMVRLGLTCLGLLLPAVLAGLRASSIGTDVKVYGITPYEWAALWPSDPAQYMSACKLSYGGSVLFDQLFCVLIYLCYQICDNYHFGLFVYNLLMIIFLYLGLKRFCVSTILLGKSAVCREAGTGISVGMKTAEELSPEQSKPNGLSSRHPLALSFGMLVFYILMYNRSLNLMRMLIAVALIFYAVTFLLEQKFIRAGIMWVIAVFLHSSALLGAGFAGLYLFSRRKPKDGLKKDLIRIAATIAGLIVLFLLITPIVRGLVSTGLLRENYLDYLPEVAYVEMELEYSWQMFLWMTFKKMFYPDGMMTVVLFLISLGAYVYEYRKGIDQHEDNGNRLFLVLCAALYMTIELVSMNSYEWARAAYYFLPFVVADHSLLLPRMFESKGRKVGTICAAVYLVFLLVMWFIIYCIWGDCSTVPYLFFWQE